jgi:4-alpha-glucanotransferase
LPGRFGIGELGQPAFEFVDFLHAAGQKLWQVLPLNPTGYGDSPYQCFSAFAGNPLLISLEHLVREGWLTPHDLSIVPDFPRHEVDYGAVIAYKLPLLHRAACAFRQRADSAQRATYAAFCAENASWLDDFALFMAAKEVFGGNVWNCWDAGLARREPAALELWRPRLEQPVAAAKFYQFEFFRQWRRIQTCCRERGIRIMGDLPIYVAHDSVDVWANPELFCLASDGSPAKVAGVPPDYFSATGQLWGNPVYRWDLLKQRNYDWWIARLRAALSLYDQVRLDHFRGFAAYWEIPAGESTAVRGKWVPGPGAELFTQLQAELGELPIVAENLGVITDDVESIRRQFGFPGMAILQFAFGTDPQAPSFRPHNYVPELVAYTGGHDNDTILGWWHSSGEADSTRTAEDVQREHGFARAYLGLADDREINWALIRTVLASVANTAIIPLQDILGCGSEGRMNLPGSVSGNWKWRFRPGATTRDLANRVKQLTVLYDR